MTTTHAAEAPLVLYDGACGLCAKSVQWILKHERDHEIRFAPLQGETAAAMRTRYPQIPQTLESVVYIDGARMWPAAWRWAYAFRWLPGFVLDLGYRFIAAIRYRVWGRADACSLVTPEQRARFLP